MTISKSPLSFRYILVTALILRLIVAPFFYHPDIKSQHFHFQYLSHGVLDIYSFIIKNRTSLPYRDTFNYLPLTYFTFGATHAVADLFVPKLDTWINDWGPSKELDPNIPLYLFFLKIPYIFADLGIGYLFYKMTGRLKPAVLWLFNPFTIYFVYILANFDIIPVFFTFLSYYLLREKRLTASALSLGLAIALKAYPVIFLPLFAFSYDNKNFKKMFLYSLFSFLPAIISLLPFIFNSYFYQSFLGSGLTQKLLERRLFSIPIFPLIYLAILADFIFYRSASSKYLSSSLFFLGLTFMVLVDFHLQWLVWFLPFIILSAYYKKSLIILSFIILLAAVTKLIFYNDSYLFWGHLIPINFQFIDLPSPYFFLSQRFGIYFSRLSALPHLLVFVFSLPAIYILRNSHEK
ncbi:MAG TPA: hypothetical protein VF828_02935 [Patescibacteria group bacterium]